MSAITFDAITYMDDLVKAGVPEPQAKVQSSALTHAIEDVVNRDLATKGDLLKVESALKVEMGELRTEIKDTEIRLIKWMIAVNATMFGLLFALFKLLV